MKNGGFSNPPKPQNRFVDTQSREAQVLRLSLSIGLLQKTGKKCSEELEFLKELLVFVCLQTAQLVKAQRREPRANNAWKKADK